MSLLPGDGASSSFGQPTVVRQALQHSIVPIQPQGLYYSISHSLVHKVIIFPGNYFVLGIIKA